MYPIRAVTLTIPSQHHYRSASYYDLPPMSEKEKREEKKYLHVLDDQ
jgi:NADH dehydrogenase (ubiquinone) 1 alpha subcomplex subunit 9